MCAVSMIVDHSPKQWPQLLKTEDPQLLKNLLKVIEMLTAIDEKLGAKDCYEPKKDEYIKQLEARIVELEGNLTKIKEHVDGIWS